MNLLITQQKNLEIREDEQARAFISKAKAENTKRSYKSDWCDFEEWCHERGYQSLPADSLTVTRYLADRASNSWTKLIQKGRGVKKISVTFSPLKPASIDRKLVSISKAHQYAGFQFDKKHILIRELIHGIKREKGIKQDQKTPILIDDLRQMIACLGNDIRGLRDRAILLLGFTAALRRSELVSLKKEDIEFTHNGVELVLRFSKTDQEGRGEILPIPYGSNTDTCPVRTLLAWLEASKIESGFLFRGINRHGHIQQEGLCAASISIIIKRNQYLSGKEKLFSGHSLRAGFCTTAASRGVSEHSIMRQSRHKKSDTIKKYIRIADTWQDVAAMKLGL